MTSRARLGAAEAKVAEARARRALGLGAASLLAGVAMVGVDASDGGMVLCLIGLVVMIAGIHTFGRLGPERGLDA